jgi:hypothetical protein
MAKEVTYGITKILLKKVFFAFGAVMIVSR